MTVYLLKTKHFQVSNLLLFDGSFCTYLVFVQLKVKKVNAPPPGAGLALQ